MRALVIGGTGPTGPRIVAGLLARGHEVTIFHRGTHELPDLAEVPGEIAVEAATTLLPLANTTATHCILSIAKAEQQLGYRPVIEPAKALEEVLEWYDEHPGFDPGASPSMTDRFDYAAEDALIASYRESAGRIRDAVGQHAASPVHSMPHPQAPGAVDHRGR